MIGESGSGTAGSGTAGAGVGGVRNFRDAGIVGSLPQGVLYRSGALCELSAEGERSLGRLGIRTVVDLRSNAEVADRPDALHSLDVEYVHAPMFTEPAWPDDQLELYPSMAERAGRPTVAVIRLLLAAGGPPVLVHCASGKDRTGVVIAVIQTLLGASESDVAADFVRSNAELGLPGPAPSSATAHGTRAVAATHLRRALGWIHSHHGSVAGYLVEHGAAKSELEALAQVARVGQGGAPRVDTHSTRE